MLKVKAITHHHHRFLKDAYRMDSYVDLVNTVDEIKQGTRFISFQPDRQLFCVYTKGKRPILVGKYDNILSAIFYASK